MNPKMQTSDAVSFLKISLQAIHQNIKANNLETFRSQNRVFFHHDVAKKIFKLKVIPKCFSWQNLKGGVGKTNLSYSIAVRLTLYGLKVAVIDLDQQGNFTQACNIDTENKPIMFDVLQNNLKLNDCMVKVIDGLYVLPSRIENALLDNLFAINGLSVDREFKKRIDPLKNDYDVIFIDCPPSLGNAVCSAALSANHIIIPTDPEKFSLLGLKITSSEINNNIANRYDIKIPIKIILNKFDARTNLSHQVLTNLLSNTEFQDKLFKSFVRISQDFPNSIAKGETIFDSLKSSTAKEDIDLLTREIIDLLSKG